MPPKYPDNPDIRDDDPTRALLNIAKIQLRPDLFPPYAEEMNRLIAEKAKPDDNAETSESR